MEKSSSSKSIEVNVISAEGLFINRKQPKNVFVILRSDPFNSRSTVTDIEGGSYPKWNERLVMELPSHARFITVEAHSGRKLIGSASIPVSDFCGGYLPDNYLSFLSYRLRDANGEKNGIINLSVMVKGKGKGKGKGASRGNMGGCAASCSRPWMGVPMDNNNNNNTNNNKVSGGMVTGIPVPYKY